MRINEIPDHNLLLEDGTCKNISVLRSEHDPNVFLAFETNFGPDHWTRAIELHEGPGGHIERAKIEFPDDTMLFCWCANTSSAGELFDKLFHYNGDRK